MDTGLPGPADYTSPRSASAGPRPGNGNPTARPRNFPSGTLRVSDADRDAALAELSQHYQAGRITTGELDDRTIQILAARTGEDLQLQLRDLPNLTAPAPAPPPQFQHRPLRTVPYAAPRLVLVAVVLAVAVIVLALTSGNHGFHVGGVAIPVVVIMLLVRRIIGHR